MWTYMMAAARGDRANSMMSSRRRTESETPNYGYNLSRPMYRSMRLNNGPTTKSHIKSTTLGGTYPYTTSTSHYATITTPGSSQHQLQQQQLQQHQHQQHLQIQHQRQHHVIGIDDDVYTNPVNSDAYDMEDSTSLFSPLTPTSTTMPADSAVVIARKHMMSSSARVLANTNTNNNQQSFGRMGEMMDDIDELQQQPNSYVGSQAAVVRLPSAASRKLSSTYYQESDDDEDFGPVVMASSKPTTMVIDHERRIRKHVVATDDVINVNANDSDVTDGDVQEDDEEDVNSCENERIKKFRRANYLETVMENGKSLTQEPSSSSVKGRPRLSFDQASHRTKRRRVDELVASTSAEAITKAAEKLSAGSNSGTISVEKALALYVDMDLSCRQYNMMRNVVNAVHKNCFPSYYSIVEAKKKFIPDGIKVSETEAHVPLQAILDKTANSILNKLEFGAENNVILECIYKQNFESQDATDEFLFVASFVPLRIMEDKNEKILWQNNRHSSLRLCRPLKILFTKENSELIMKVKDDIHREIEQLTTYVYNNDKKKIKVQYRLKLTMIDGAVLNAIHGHKSCATCVLCGAKPTQMNTELVLEKNVNENCYKYGLSTLHAWIKFFECIVHIAYKLPIKSWRIVDEQNKRVVAENKEKIQKKTQG